MPKEEEPTKLFECPDCGKTFKSRNALNGHKSMCRAAPDEKDEPEENDTITEGITIFDDDDDDDEEKPRRRKAREEDDDDESYVCGGCGYTSKKEFNFCPKCGEENEF